MARKKKIEIFRLEDRVLFEAAGAVEAIAAESLAEDANPDRQNEISESERQEKEAQSVAKEVGPATVNGAGQNGSGSRRRTLPEEIRTAESESGSAGQPCRFFRRNRPERRLFHSHFQFPQYRFPASSHTPPTPPILLIPTPPTRTNS